jgi:class 3 adenylate cyclase
MADRTKTLYARDGDVHVAYQTVGDGPIDLVHAAGAFTHLDVLWEFPLYRRFCEQLASFSRLILFDKRGMGLSDHVHVGTLEQRMDDVRAVLDAVGSEQAAVMGTSEGGPMCMLFAATYPERTRALILCGAEVKESISEDWPWGESTDEEFEQHMEGLADRWGSGRGIAVLAPSLADDERAKEWLGRLTMQSASPGTAEAFMRMAHDIDVRECLSAINVPTLIVHRAGDRTCNVHNGRYLAEHIAGARYIELDGVDHLPYVDGDEIVAEIQQFLTGVRETVESDRILATIMFTDIVGSTQHAERVGDRRWRELLENHHAIVRQELERYRGRELDTAGDGFFAAFDGPARAIRCAQAVRRAVARAAGIEIRTGLHTGECERLGEKLSGIAVHIGARVAAHADPGEVLVSRTVKDLVAGSGIAFTDRGAHQLKGVSGIWELYAVESPL